MAKKQIFTDAEIEKDIICALKNPQGESKKSYKSWKVPIIISACVAAAVSFFYPTVILWILAAALVLSVGEIIFRRVRLKNQIKNIKLSDYEISTETVSHAYEDGYVVNKGPGLNETVYNSTLHFEGGKLWKIPKENYLWSEERPMSDCAVCRSAHRGDLFTAVIKKDTGKVVMAYHNEFFEYKII